MRKWYAVLANKPRDCVVIEQGALDDAALKRFDETAALNMVRGVGVIAMWIVDHGTSEVVKCHGRVDARLQARHKEYLASKAEAEKKPTRA